MRLKSVQVKNYKSIIDSGKVLTNNIFCVLAGKNNVGKTALIEAIYKMLHGGISIIGDETSTSEGIQQNFKAIIEMEVEITNKVSAISGVFGDFGSGNLLIRLIGQNGSTFIESIFDLETNYSLSLTTEKEVTIRNCPLAGNYLGMLNSYKEFYYELANSFVFIGGTRSYDTTQIISSQGKLHPSASNFPNYMFTLHNNNEIVFDAVQKSFTSIFTDVELISTPLLQGNTTNIRLLFDGQDQPIPLEECGSGFSHVLVMLTVLHSQRDKIVLYDEPHVYLHPSAEKAIYDLAKEHDSHHFIFTTHSPILINYPCKKNVYLVTKNDGQSSFTSLEDVGKVLDDIGLKNSDFAFAEKVLFVEGETEEQLIPRILNKYGMKQVGYNYRILNMKGTGSEFKNSGAMSHNSQKLELIFKGLSDNPIPYKILLDKDEKNTDQIKKLTEIYGNQVVLLPRREIENYFLEHYEPISEILHEIVETEIDPTIVKRFISQKLKKVEDYYFYPKGCQNQLHDIIGSRVLEKLFEKYGARYNKVTHGILITEWLLEKKPDALAEIADFLKPFIKGVRDERESKQALQGCLTY